MTVCIQCGRCCASGILCYFGQIVFDITERNPQSCPALEKDNDIYWCGIIKNPASYLQSMVGSEAWKLEAMAEIASVYIGIGDGCGSNPSVKKIMARFKEYAGARKNDT